MPRRRQHDHTGGANPDLARHAAWSWQRWLSDNDVSVGRGDWIDVSIELPAGSQTQGSRTRALFRSQGRLGDCDFRNVFGSVELDHAGSLDLQSRQRRHYGEQATGHVKVSSVSGRVRVHRVHGTVEIASSSPDLSIGEAFGGLRLNAGKRHISVEAAHVSLRRDPNEIGCGVLKPGRRLRRVALPCEPGG